jgi:hypothetical protein
MLVRLSKHALILSSSYDILGYREKAKVCSTEPAKSSSSGTVLEEAASHPKIEIQFFNASKGGKGRFRVQINLL